MPPGGSVLRAEQLADGGAGPGPEAAAAARAAGLRVDAAAWPAAASGRASGEPAPRS